MKPMIKAAALAAVLLAAPAAAQEADNPFPYLNQTPTAPAGDTDPADALARNLRVLGDDPNNLAALMGAGRAALEVGDPSSSIGFWARADKVSPNSGPVKAGLAAALVQAERPRLAFPLFTRAVALGVPEADLAADRGLAYDLTGDNRQAQRDYRLSLGRHPDPETTRRLALSLAMSGDRAGALAALDPLLRKQDMGAWRARAFVLALTGDTAGAIADAHALLPKPQADGISPFLTRLGSLNHEQQASAVHFGEMPATGRAATTLTLASNAPVAGAGPGASTASLNRAQAQATVPAAQAAAPRSAVSRPVPGPVTGSVDFAGRAPGQATTAPPASAAPPRSAPPVYAQAAPTRPATPVPNPRATPPAYAQASPPPGQLAPATAPPTYSQPSSTAPAPSSTIARSAAPLQPAPPPSAPTTAEVARAPITSLAPPPRTATPAPVGSGSVRSLAPPPPRLAANTLGAETLALGGRLPTTRTPILAANSGDIASTGSVALASRPVPTPSRNAVRTTRAEPVEAGDVASAKRGARPKTTDTATGADSKSAAAAKAKALADAKADRAAKAKALADAKADREAKAAAKAAPARVWVQVAGGANKHDLGKEWAKLNKQAGGLYAGRTPQTIAYRHTNRLMVGPFKSEDEAQEYVNKLTKGGQSGFIVKTTGGQTVEKVPTD